MFNFNDDDLHEFVEEALKENQQDRNEGARAYKCPNCQGEFNQWQQYRGGSVGCPFCGINRGSYEGTGEVSDNDDMSDGDQRNPQEEMAEQLIENMLGVSLDDFDFEDEDQTNLQDLLEGGFRSPEQDR